MKIWPMPHPSLRGWTNKTGLGTLQRMLTLRGPSLPSQCFGGSNRSQRRQSELTHLIQGQAQTPSWAYNILCKLDPV